MVRRSDRLKKKAANSPALVTTPPFNRKKSAEVHSANIQSAMNGHPIEPRDNIKSAPTSSRVRVDCADEAETTDIVPQAQGSTTYEDKMVPPMIEGDPRPSHSPYSSNEEPGPCKAQFTSTSIGWDLQYSDNFPGFTTNASDDGIDACFERLSPLLADSGKRRYLCLEDSNSLTDHGPAPPRESKRLKLEIKEDGAPSTQHFETLPRASQQYFVSTPSQSTPTLQEPGKKSDASKKSKKSQGNKRTRVKTQRKSTSHQIDVPVLPSDYPAVRGIQGVPGSFWPSILGRFTMMNVWSPVTSRDSESLTHQASSDSRDAQWNWEDVIDWSAC